MTTAEERMPAVFFGHGTPMNALDQNMYTEAWRVFGQTVPRPRAILVVQLSINATKSFDDHLELGARLAVDGVIHHRL
jgi:aromatic ring-opening dioxygenase catalytic subunit (LigB family)